MKNVKIGTCYERLTVINEFLDTEKNKKYWICDCACGNKNVKIPKSSFQRKGRETKSCGCLIKEKARNRFTTHNLSDSKLHGVWKGIKERCYYKKHQSFHNYGGRGIEVCDEWLDKEKGFINFYEWALSNGYEEGLSIDRIKVNGNYEPNNCRWATKKEQGNNKRNNKLINHQNMTMTISEWAEFLQISEKMIRNRVYRGITGEELFTPSKKFIQPLQSKVKGVKWDKSKNKWVANISFNKKYYPLGEFNFDDLKKAIVARLKAELKFYGFEKSPQRKLFDEYNIKEGDTFV